MANNTVPYFGRTTRVEERVINSSTALADLATQGTGDDSKVRSINVRNTHSSTVIVRVYYYIGSTARVLLELTLPASMPMPVELLKSGRIPPLASDQAGNYIALNSTATKLQCAVTTSVASDVIFMAVTEDL